VFFPVQVRNRNVNGVASPTSKIGVKFVIALNMQRLLMSSLSRGVVGWKRVGTAFPLLFALVTLLEDLAFHFNFYV